MAYNLGTEDEPILVNARVSGGQIDLLVRSDSLEDLHFDMRMVGLSYRVFEEQIDQDTGEVSKVDTGEDKLSKGVFVDVMEGLWVKEPTVDSEGNVIREGEYDNRVYANIRIVEPASSVVEDGENKVLSWLEDWMLFGIDDPQTQNKEESGVRLFRTTLLDPDSIKTPKRVFL